MIHEIYKAGTMTAIITDIHSEAFLEAYGEWGPYSLVVIDKGKEVFNDTRKTRAEIEGILLNLAPCWTDNTQEVANIVAGHNKCMSDAMRRAQVDRQKANASVRNFYFGMAACIASVFLFLGSLI